MSISIPLPPPAPSGRAEPVEQAMHERLPLVELLQADELVGFVRLLVVAGTAADIGDAAAGLAQSVLGPSGDLAVLFALSVLLAVVHPPRIPLSPLLLFFPSSLFFFYFF